MAKQKKTYKKSLKKSRYKTLKDSLKNKQTNFIIGVFLLIVSIFLLLSFISYLSNWKVDQSTISQLGNKTIIAQNLLGKIGAVVANFFIYNGFGIASFYIPILMFLTGVSLLLSVNLQKINKPLFWGILAMIWFSISLNYIFPSKPLLGGVVGFELNDYSKIYIGKTGIGLTLLFFAIIYFVIRFKLSPIQLSNFLKARINKSEKNIQETVLEQQEKTNTINLNKEVVTNDSLNNISNTQENIDLNKDNSDVKIVIEKPKEEGKLSENLSDKIVKDFGEFDPKLELSNYKFPGLDLLFEYKNENITVNQEELEANKNKIVETLSNYKIGIASIKATIGPTVTLYEIVPDAGIRISKIKNLEDDIALSLAALGIRIIAPIPGKGTIGIEVPNKKPTIVSMKSVLSSQKFQNAQMELPVALGKSISNETFVYDLTKMPHLLMAGATGQGKSVGLNAVLASLLYKKHPAEVKFVLVDPKKVELTLFNKIERHYLAKLPDTEEAIITDTTKIKSRKWP